MLYEHPGGRVGSWKPKTWAVPQHLTWIDVGAYPIANDRWPWGLRSGGRHKEVPETAEHIRRWKHEFGAAIAIAIAAQE